MPLRFSRLKNEMSYFENADELTIESVLDLMFDLYSDVAEGIGIGPEVCECDDSDALAENLIWMGTVFQNICRIYGKDIAVSDSLNQGRLSEIQTDLEQEVLALLKRKDAYEKTKAQVVSLQKEKRTLEGELSECKQKQPDLKTLENRVSQLKIEKEKAERDRKTKQDNCRQMMEEIDRLNEEIAELTPSVNVLTTTLKARRDALMSLNTQIVSGDAQIQRLNEQIERLRKDIERSDRVGILQHLQEQKSELEQIKTEIAGYISLTRKYEEEIKDSKENKQRKKQVLDQRRLDQEKLQRELEQLEGVFDALSSNQEQYNKLKRRYNSLKMIAEQLQKDGAILCKRTCMQNFSLQDDLERGMNAVGSYLSAVAVAIDQYSRKAEDSLKRS